jgi:hypothetical protein
MTEYTDLKLTESGEILDTSGNLICHASELPAILGMEDTGLDDIKNPFENKNEYYNPAEATTEIFIRRSTTFELPPEKKQVQDALWSLFNCGIHQTLSNITSQKQKNRALDLAHGTIIASLLDPKVADTMTPADYIQAHVYAENLIARATTYEGDGFRDATLWGRNVDPTALDALKYNTDHPKGSGGFLSAFKRR